MFYFFPSLSLLLGCGLCEGRDFVRLVCCAPALGEVWKEPPAVGEKRTLSLGSRLPPPPPPFWSRPQGFPTAAAHPHPGSPSMTSPGSGPFPQGTSHILLSSTRSLSCFPVETPSEGRSPVI